jgi:hypothetical protein
MNVPRWIVLRDIILFFGGLAGIAYQLVAAKVVEPTLTVVFAAMMGLPAALWGDHKRKDDDGKGGPSDGR